MVLHARNLAALSFLLAGALVYAQQDGQTLNPDSPQEERQRTPSGEKQRASSVDGKRSDGSRRFPSFGPRRSTAEYLRELLVMTPEQLEQELAQKGESRTFWKGKVEEYKALPPHEREVRLQTTQMKHYLEPLLYLKPEHRKEKLANIPEDFRPLVEERLKLWDQLPRESRKEVLDNKWVMTYFSRLEAAPPDQKDNVFLSVSAEHRKRVEAQLDEWRALPRDQRLRMYENFNQFFQLSAKEQERILGTVPHAERKQIDATLEQFEKLPPEERKACIESFRKYVNMTPEQRAQFHKNVELWNKMSPEEKAKWRTVAPQLPPLPPGLAPFPPLPPSPQFQRKSPPLPNLPAKK